MSYWLLDHENPNGRQRSNGKRGWYFPSRAKPIDLIVMHVPVAAFDSTGEDQTAESVADYFTRNSRPASAHVVIDRDSTVELLPDDHTAFHVRSYNSRSLGIEQGWDPDDWGRSEEFDRAVITQVAAWLRPRVDQYNIPLIRLTKAQVDAGRPGFTEHSLLDPTRRTDPGPDYPWDLLFAFLSDDPDPVFDPPSSYAAASWQKALDAEIMTKHSDPHKPMTKQEYAMFLDRQGVI